MSKALKAILFYALPALLVGGAIYWIVKKRKANKTTTETPETPETPATTSEGAIASTGGIMPEAAVM